MSRKKLIGIVAACIIVVTVVLVISLSGRGSVVTFPDPNLETAIREALNKPSGPIHASELAGLASLTASDSGIEHLSGLQYCTNLTDLDFWHNQISDISPLANLTSLTYLYLPRNQISDILPLVNNPGLSQGDEVYLSSNPLSSTSMNTYIPQLQARGVTVHWP
ncbi:MAG: leucine-rich repeat domain-containing protein [Dehalococcoidia bacterium]|nr:leucine-rich repeat domain-containing protein [Dehalococcoidia bacterium]